jgi:hypothetical protein
MSLLRILLIGVFITAAASAEVLFRVEVSPSGVALPEDDRGLVTVRVVSDERVGQPVLKIEGGELIVEGGGQSSFQFQNLGLGGGRQRHDRTHRFEVGGAPGKYTIVAVVKNQKGEEYESDSVALSIRKLSVAEKDRQPELHIRLQKQTVYVGQAIDAEVLVLPKNGSQLMRERNNDPKFSGDGFTATTVGDPYLAEALNGLAAAGFGAVITPLKPGPISISATFQPIIGVRSVTGITRQKRFTLESKPVDRDVRTAVQIDDTPRFQSNRAALRRAKVRDSRGFRPRDDRCYFRSVFAICNFTGIAGTQNFVTRSD